MKKQTVRKRQILRWSEIIVDTVETLLWVPESEKTETVRKRQTVRWSEIIVDTVETLLWVSESEKNRDS